MYYAARICRIKKPTITVEAKSKADSPLCLYRISSCRRSGSGGAKLTARFDVESFVTRQRRIRRSLPSRAFCQSASMEYLLRHMWKASFGSFAFKAVRSSAIVCKSCPVSHRSEDQRRRSVRLNLMHHWSSGTGAERGNHGIAPI